MSDLEDFFEEQNERMNMPDESIGHYISRMAVAMNRDIIPSSIYKTDALNGGHQDQQTAALAKICEENTVSNTPSRHIQTVPKRADNDFDVSVAKKQKRNEHRFKTSSRTTRSGSETSHRVQDREKSDIHARYHSSDGLRPFEGESVRDGARLLTSAPPERAETSTSEHCTSEIETNIEVRGTRGAASDYLVNETLKTTHHPKFATSLSNIKMRKARTDSIHPIQSQRSGSDIPLQASLIQLLETFASGTADRVGSTDRDALILVPLNPTTPQASYTSPSSVLIPSSTYGSPSGLLEHRVAGVTSESTRHKPSPSAVTAAGTVISGFVPQASSTQLQDKYDEAGPRRREVWNHSSAARSGGGSKRDQIMNTAPNPVQPTDTILDTSSALLVSSSDILGVPTKDRHTVAPIGGPSKSAVVQKKSTILKGKKTTKERVTPLAYAQTLCARLDILAKKTQFLKGKRVFYADGDFEYASEPTMKKMKLIIQNGGILVPKYHPEAVTHIVTDTFEGLTLRALGLKSLKDISSKIPVVTWSWVTEGRGRTGLTEIQHAAFSSHIVDSLSNSDQDDSEDFSRISQFTQDKPKPTPKRSASSNNLFSPVPKADGQDSLNVQVGKKRTEQVDDPLAEFYDQAKAERDDACSSGDEYTLGIDHQESDDGESDNDYDYNGEAGPPIKRGFTCDNKVDRREGSKNQDILERLQELMELHKSKPSKDDFWRGFSYSRSIGPIRNHPRRIQSYAEARSIRGVGHKTAEKIMEIIQTGGLRRIAFENTEDVEAAKIFTGIYGVGQTIAYQWYAAGCRTLDDVRKGKGGVKLTPAMEIGLQFYDDINTRMPREEAGELFNLIKPIALKLDPRLFIEIMGSYRRGKKDCGDIDIMITRPTDDKKTHAGIVPQLLQALHDAGIVTEDLALPDDLHVPEAIYRGLCKLPDTLVDGKVVLRLRRRIDILSIPWQNRGGALLYYTGDDIFNRAMRFKANKMGYSLNQRGLFQGVVRDPRDRRKKTNTGNLIASETEEEIFKILGVPWQEPHERIRSH